MPAARLHHMDRWHERQTLVAGPTHLPARLRGELGVHPSPLEPNEHDMPRAARAEEMDPLRPLELIDVAEESARASFENDELRVEVGEFQGVHPWNFGGLGHSVSVFHTLPQILPRVQTGGDWNSTLLHFIPNATTPALQFNACCKSSRRCS